MNNVFAARKAQTDGIVKESSVNAVFDANKNGESDKNTFDEQASPQAKITANSKIEG